jgi:hypothetical protein
VPFALESFRLHRELATALAAGGTASYALEPVTRVLVAFDEKDEDELDAVERAFAGHPSFATARLSAASLRTIEPRLASAVRIGLLIEGNYSLDSRAFHLAIAAAARDAGPASFVRRRQVHGARRIRHAGTHDRRQPSLRRARSGDGPWVAETREWIGVDLPVTPVKGEMLRLRLRERSISHDFTHGLISSIVAAMRRFGSASPAKRQGSTSLRPRRASCADRRRGAYAAGDRDAELIEHSQRCGR